MSRGATTGGSGGARPSTAEMGAQARKDVESRWNAENEQVAYVDFYERLLEMPAR